METSSKQRATFGWSSLTERERDVAGLVAEGLTNRELAVELFVSHYTIDAHLRQIYRKLSIGSRVDLTRVVILRLAAANRADTIDPARNG